MGYDGKRMALGTDVPGRVRIGHRVMVPPPGTIAHAGPLFGNRPDPGGFGGGREAGKDTASVYSGLTCDGKSLPQTCCERGLGREKADVYRIASDCTAPCT
ncbi:hypothetical protein GCM10010359_31860 [Streptomyces morookaense]|nr:hypothetical protein GCM10010359_31860 [Streptomyces morookaense]